jgi:uncharacterized protein (UPF0332 family)
VGGKVTNEFEECKAKKRITEFPRAANLVAKELSQAAADLSTAQESVKSDNYKWATIQAYYSMFHSARALLYSKGYRERSHYCLMVAIRALYVDTGLLSYKAVEGFQLAKTLRENADYYGDFSKDSCLQILNDAKTFLGAAKKLTK